MGIRTEDVTLAHLVRAWSDDGTVLDFFTLTEAVRVRIRFVDVIEQAGAQFLAYEMELVEFSSTPAGPTPVEVVDLLIGGIVEALSDALDFVSEITAADGISDALDFVSEVSSSEAVSETLTLGGDLSVPETLTELTELVVT